MDASVKPGAHAGKTLPPSASGALWWVGAAPVFAQVFGSVFNIWYNVIHIQPLLTAEQHARFLQSVSVFNSAGYPLLLGIWVAVVLTLRAPFRALRRGEPLAAETLARARRRVINLPWHAVAVAGIGWLLCIPVFLPVLLASPEPLDRRVLFHLPLSVAVSALIALTHVFLVVELLTQRLLYPVFFPGKDARPSRVSGAWPLSLRGRGILWAVSAGVCPIISLLLLILAPHPDAPRNPSFALAVGALGVLFVLSSAWMVSQLVVAPVHALRHAARQLGRGDLSTHIDMPRADEFGPLIDAFNDMAEGLRDKQRIVDTFGRHVGRATAEHILQRNAGLGGTEKIITIMFVDIREFTRRCDACSPRQAVAVLNTFLTAMVEIVEHHGGIVNKFLGDGFMAVFGAADDPDHATRAVRSGCNQLRRLRDLNREWSAEGQPALAIGIGIHTGEAVVGSIGSPQRMEYTAIGDAVNIASRVESLTKAAGRPLLFTEQTFRALDGAIPAVPLPAQKVKGKAESITIYSVEMREQTGN